MITLRFVNPKTGQISVMWLPASTKLSDLSVRYGTDVEILAYRP